METAHVPESPKKSWLAPSLGGVNALVLAYVAMVGQDLGQAVDRLRDAIRQIEANQGIMQVEIERRPTRSEIPSPQFELRVKRLEDTAERLDDRLRQVERIK